uniref:Secreted protein n=1 Tax=Arion vulgaris TaxID=1028688 RepID=A0A0B6ZQC5_9EUPU
MANFCRAGVLVIFILFSVDVDYGSAKCPEDYRYRVEMCVMEAQVAPQAGGGLPLITDSNKLEELCVRGILQKTIDCLRDIYDRCSNNITQKQELDMLFSVEEWKHGQTLLCEDLNLFKNHFDCVSKFGPRISSCILVRTQLFKKAVTDAGIAHFRTLHDITCNFAQNIVNCLERPLARSCSLEVVDTMVSALHRFLPPACAPVPALYEAEDEQMEDTRSTAHQDEQHEPMIYETVIVEGGDGGN